MNWKFWRNTKNVSAMFELISINWQYCFSHQEIWTNMLTVGQFELFFHTTWSRADLVAITLDEKADVVGRLWIPFAGAAPASSKDWTWTQHGAHWYLTATSPCLRTLLSDSETGRWINLLPEILTEEVIFVQAHGTDMLRRKTYFSPSSLRSHRSSSPATPREKKWPWM